MGAHAHPASSEKDNMKGIQVLFISCLAAAAFGEEAAGESSSSNTRAGGGSSGGGAAGNTRLFGGLGAGLLGGLAQGISVALHKLAPTMVAAPVMTSAVLIPVFRNTCASLPIIQIHLVVDLVVDFKEDSAVNSCRYFC